MGTRSGAWSSNVLNGCMASVVLYYVLDLSSSGRTWIDYAVISLVIGAIVWNIIQLGRKFFGAAGIAGTWSVGRTVLFWIIGLFNTLMIRPDDIGSWKNWIGWLLLGIAAADTVALYIRERKLSDHDQQP